MPNKRADGNVVRSYAVARDLHEQATSKASAEGTTVSAIIRTAIEDYARSPQVNANSAPTPDVEVSLTEADVVALSECYRPALHLTDELVETVERIIADRIAQALARVDARAAALRANLERP